MGKQNVDPETLQLSRIRRWAQRKRIGKTCLRCKSRKTRCSSFRPCARCLSAGNPLCADEHPSTPVIVNDACNVHQYGMKPSAHESGSFASNRCARQEMSSGWPPLTSPQIADAISTQVRDENGRIFLINYQSALVFEYYLRKSDILLKSS